jgi:hypothetical protein
MLMMSSVHRDPFKHWALNRHGPEYGQNGLDCAISFKRMMSEQPVEANRYAEGRQQIHTQ